MKDYHLIIKIGLAILFILCLLDVPYGFFMLVRVIALAGFGILAYHSYKHNEGVAVVAYIILAILFQPIFKISLGREVWNIIDIIVAIGLIVSVYRKRLH